MPSAYLIHLLLFIESSWLLKLGNYISEFFSGYGGIAVLLLAVADSSFLSFPEGNDLLIVILSTGGSWANMAYFVSLTVTGSVIGCFLLYTVGRKGGRAILKRKFSDHKIEKAEKAYSRYGILAVLIPSVLPPPLPFKIFVLSAGVFGLPQSRFLMAVAIGRSIRYSLWGILAVLYGNSVKLFLQNNMNSVGTVLLTVLGLIISCVLVLQVIKKRKRRKLARPED